MLNVVKQLIVTYLRVEVNFRGVFAINAEISMRVSEKFCAKHRHPDILLNRKLLADSTY